MSLTCLIGQAHTVLHRNGVMRIETDVRIGTRTEKEEHFAEKVSKVESILARKEDTTRAERDQRKKQAVDLKNLPYCFGT